MIKALYNDNTQITITISEEAHKALKAAGRTNHFLIRPFHLPGRRSAQDIGLPWANVLG
jgi:hypothetical protein